MYPNLFAQNTSLEIRFMLITFYQMLGRGIKAYNYRTRIFLIYTCTVMHIVPSPHNLP